MNISFKLHVIGNKKISGIVTEKSLTPGYFFTENDEEHYCEKQERIIFFSSAEKEKPPGIRF